MCESVHCTLNVRCCELVIAMCPVEHVQRTGQRVDVFSFIGSDSSGFVFGARGELVSEPWRGPLQGCA